MKKIIIPIIVIGIALGIIFLRKPAEENNIPEQTISIGDVEFKTPSDFGLATSPDQILVKSYIPSCSEPFDYCFYYNGNEFEKTNFESAGIRIVRRADLKTEGLCPKSIVPIGDAGAGHYANGELYRIFLSGTCFEIETRIGETQFANFPAGSVEKFDETDRDVIYGKFREFFDSFKIKSTGQRIVLPDSEN